MCVYLVFASAGEGQKGVADPMELELQVSVSYLVGAKKQTQLPFKSSEYS